jgi:hypothetical protein
MINLDVSHSSFQTPIPNPQIDLLTDRLVEGGQEVDKTKSNVVRGIK